MAQNDFTKSPKWKKPNELMALHRLKKKKKALQERMCAPSQSCPELSSVFGANSLNFTKLLGAEKRKNPFAKNSLERQEKVFCEKSPTENDLDESTDSTLFKLLGIKNDDVGDQSFTESVVPISFANILNSHSIKTKENDFISSKCTHIPIDWTLKTKMRFMSSKPFAWSQKLKASEEASGITGFVRCLDTSNSSTLDTSHHARFHQHCMYWQHPVLPWLSLFPRNNGKVSKVNFISSNEDITGALHREWTESFRSLFQLVRARQCPYFYVCANTFTCLFLAAGMNGITETSVFVTPTTRGFRQTLKHEEIEYTMPLKKVQNSKRNSDSTSPKGHAENPPNNTSFDSCYDTLDDNISAKNCEDEDRDGSGDEDMCSEEWLQSLGVAADEIKKINNSRMKLKNQAECSIDNSAESLVCIKGVDAQALFNFLLNCKSCIPTTGTYGGIPPTLLSPTAFQGGTLQALKVRESIVHTDDGKYHSIEIRGPILPTTVHSLCSLIRSNSNSFSATFANMSQTTPFSSATKAQLNEEKSKENVSGNAPSVFGRENLSDCGLNVDLLEMLCSSDPKMVEPFDSLKYCQDKKSYVWL